MNKFDVGDLVRIVHIRKCDADNVSYEKLLENIGFESKIIHTYKRSRETQYILEGLGLYAWFEDELELVKTVIQPVTEDELLNCFGREGD